MKDSEKDWLKDFVDQNRDEFDSQEPSPTLWDGIQLPPKKSNNWAFYLQRVAAVAVIVLAVSAYWNWNPENETKLVEPENTIQETKLATSPLPELMEAEAFYTHQMDNMLQQLRQTNGWGKELDDAVANDMAELDRAYNELKNDLREDAANKAIVEAMLQNYRLKVKILEDILNRLAKTENPSDTHGNQDYLL